MGLFDRFRKRIHEVADETDQDALSVDAASEEAKELLQPTPQIQPEEEWDDLENLESTPEAAPETDGDDDWDTWDDDEPIVPVASGRKNGNYWNVKNGNERKRKHKRRRP